MAIENITIDKFEDEKVNKDNLPDDSGTLKKKVGFKVVDDNGSVYIIDGALGVLQRHLIPTLHRYVLCDAFIIAICMSDSCV